LLHQYAAAPPITTPLSVTVTLFERKKRKREGVVLENLVQKSCSENYVLKHM